MSQSNLHYQEVIKYLRENLVLYKENHCLKYDTYFKMGGTVKLYILPSSSDQLMQAVGILNDLKLSYKIVGATSNVFFIDELTYSIIINTREAKEAKVEENVLEVDAGYLVPDLVRVALINVASGFEGLEGIPASVGGALYMNAGAYGHSISDNLISVKCINEDNQVVNLDKSECEFSYRSSIFQHSSLKIVSAKFKLIKGNQAKIARNIEIYHIARHSYQDFVYPNLGSMISIQGDVYKHIFTQNKFYLFIYLLIKLIFRNPVSKFLNRKRPNNEVSNFLMLRFLKKSLNKKHINQLSNKNINILLNTGGKDSLTVVSHLYFVRKLIKSECHVENEIVLEPLHEYGLTYNEVKNTVEKYL